MNANDLNALGALQQQLAALQQSVAGLYLPSPRRALEVRPRRPLDIDNATERCPFAPVAQPIYTSQGLDTKGYTLQNAFATITIPPNPDPNTNPATTDIILLGALEGSFGGGSFNQIAQAVIPYSGPGSYPVPVLAGNTLALQVRFVLLANGTADFANTRIRFHLKGTLVAGLRF